MNTLEDKYIQDKLTVEELNSFNQTLDSISDAEIARHLEHIWSHETDTVQVSAELSEGLWRRISRRLALAAHEDGETEAAQDRPAEKASAHRARLRIGLAAAAVLLPLLLISAFYLGRHSRQSIASPVTIVTNKGERATVVLPDSTVIDLNCSSRLTYNPASFDGKAREVAFSGEAYFNVAKDREHPFTVRTHRLTVNVLGTRFNLSARPTCNTAYVALEEGSVKLIETESGGQALLSPGQVAMVDTREGRIRLVRPSDLNDFMAWKRHEMRFTGADFNKVVTAIENVYGIHIEVHKGQRRLSAFTGTLPTNDLHEALEILSIGYHLRLSSNGKTFIMTAQ